MKALRYIPIFVFAILARNGYGQALTIKANQCYQAQDYECAKDFIDSAIVSNERFNSQTWQLRGLVYRKLETAETKDYRNISIESFVQARNLDSTGTDAEKIKSFLYGTIIRYYNDAVIQLEQKELDNSESSYLQYKTKYKKYLDADFDFSSNDIEYYNALGSEYLKLASSLQGEEKERKAAKGIHFYEEVLKLDSNQFQPNFNVGITYYNRGADIIVNFDENTPIEDIPAIEEKSQGFFQNALPFLKRAHSIEPERTDVIEAITGCYYGLLDNENYIKFQTILDKKNLPILLEKFQQNPKDRNVLEELTRIYYATLKDEEQYNKYSELLEKLETDE